MAGRKASSAGPVPVVQLPAAQDATTQRAFDVVAGAVQELQARRTGGVSVTGSRSGGDALESLLARLEELGIIKDDTTA